MRAARPRHVTIRRADLAMLVMAERERGPRHPDDPRGTSMSDVTTKETLGFQAEVKQLLHLMIHSLYGNKEIFLRELVSNASDACDKLRFEAMADAALLENDPDLQIRVGYDPAARTITVSDNGIGMSRQEVIEHIGTIAKSGTREFFSSSRRQRQGRPADRPVRRRLLLRLHRRRRGHAADAPRRAAAGAGRALGEPRARASTAIETITGDTRGTDVILHLRPDEDELLSGYAAARDPAQVLRPHHRADPDEEGAVGRRGEGAGRHRRGRAGQPGVGAVGAAEVARSPRSSTRSSTSTSRTTSSRRWPTRHARVEGRQRVHAAVLHPAARAVRPVGPRASRHGIKLYVRRVFIMDDAEQLMPAYLRFVRGDHRLERPAAERLARDPAGVARRRRRSGAASTKRVLGLLEDLAAERSRRSTRRSGRSSAAC